MGMTREKAINVLSGFKVVGIRNDDTQLYQALYLAISALREQERIAEIGKTSGWISVEERLPEAFVSVLVYMPEERPLPTVHEGYIARDGKWYAHFFSRDPGEVTHWMPLPEPPRED